MFLKIKSSPELPKVGVYSKIQYIYIEISWFVA